MNTEQARAIVRIRRRVRAFKAGRAGLPNVWTGEGMMCSQCLAVLDDDLLYCPKCTCKLVGAASVDADTLQGSSFCWQLGHRQWKKAQRS